MAAKKEKTDGESAQETPATPDLTYEQARDQLIEIVNRLESGGENLSKSMTLFKRGEQLAALCEKYLADARATVEAAQQDTA